MDVTDEALRSLEACPDPRLRTVMQALVRHMHAFAAEVQLTPDEWAAGMAFLTATGQMCTPLRQEFYLLSDTLGLTMAVDAIAHADLPAGATESSVTGPFHTDDAPTITQGETIARGGKGESVLVSGVVRDAHGAPIAGARVEAWETDGDGLYDTQYRERGEPDYRGVMTTDTAGAFTFRAVKPVSYSIPTDGPVGTMLRALNRSAMRPAHLHIRVSAAGKRTLTTSFYTDDDPYLQTDAVFGVRPSLVVAYELAGGEIGTRWRLRRDLVLADS
jgi:protocatechuate 3,4-dioxygenase beta subunit